MLTDIADACMQNTLENVVTQLLSWNNVIFAATVVITFLVIGCGCYAACGYDFLHETFLYHSGRKDPRHNFSIYFYSAYLEYGKPGASSISW